MRVAFYARVSTERQQQAQTIEQQVTRLREYVASHDEYAVREEHIFRDDGYSGATLKRPGLDALRDEAAQATFEGVLVTAPDRLARNYVHQMVLLEELAQRGCPVQFLDHPLGNDPHDHLVVQIRGAVAEYERTLIADRMRRGRQAKLRSGRLLPWTRAPYGYRLDPERPRDPTLVRVDTAEAAIVQDLFMTYAAGEATLWALAKGLTDRGVLSPAGRNHWTASSIRGILINPCYTGLAVSGRWQVVPARRRASALRPIGPGWSHSARAHPQAEQITIPVPALVSAEQFALVQQRLATNQQLALRSTTHEYLVRGLVSCGRCRLQCTGRQNQHAERYRYYVCRGKQPPTSSSHDDRCPARFIPAAQLDELVWTDLCQVLQHPEHLRQALDRAEAGTWLPDELRRRQATLRSIQAGLARQRERLLEAYLAEVVALAEFERKDGELRHRQEDLARQERELAARNQRQLEVSVLAQSMIEICERLRRGLDHATFAQRRQLVELLIDRVVVTDGTVEIRYVIPTTEASTHTRFCHLRTDYFDLPGAALAVEQDAASPVQVVADDVVQIPMAVCCHDESDGAVVGEMHRAHPGTRLRRGRCCTMTIPAPGS
jgi:site-specific DNA recombinase